MPDDDSRHNEMLHHIQMLLKTLPDYVVEQLVKQWESELEDLYIEGRTSANLSESDRSFDDKV